MKTSLHLPIWVLWFFEVWLLVLVFFYLDLPAIDVMQIDRFSGEQLRHVVVESDSTSNL